MSVERTLQLRSASEYNLPKLRRMARELPPPSFSVEYKLTSAGAEAIEANPQVLLHHRLYKMNVLGRGVLYYVDGRPTCFVQTTDYFNMGSFGKPSRGEVLVYSMDEIPAGVRWEEERIGRDYPSAFLPFDLNTLKSGIEATLSTVVPVEGRSAVSPIYLGACPFEVYQAFHWLTRYPNGLQERILGMREVVEVGSGLGIMSFIVSQLMSAANVRGIDIDRGLLVQALQLKKVLERIGYDLGRATFYFGDIATTDRIRIEETDALLGFYPLTQEGDEWLFDVFKRLRSGGLVFELHNKYPLNDWNCRKIGFREVKIPQYPYFPFHIFEKV